MRELADRTWFRICLAAGRLFRSSRYSEVEIVAQEGEIEVRKRRRLYAPPIIWASGPVFRLLRAGVRVLPQRDWTERERTIYRSLHGTEVRVDRAGNLVLPLLPGRTLATLLADPHLDDTARLRAIQLSAIALGELHRAGFTHGDAMAENVLVDLGNDAARWIDFETLHDPGRPAAWRRADDMRALLATCLVRTPPEQLSRIFDLILDACPDEALTGQLAGMFTSVLQRPLAFHLGQAPMSLELFRRIARLLSERSCVSVVPPARSEPE